jgi:putative ABC transport system substrate-binding protein
VKRREFIARLGGAATWPLAAGAEAQKDRVYRVGILSLLKRPSEEVFRDAMRDLGYVEGKNVLYDVRYAGGNQLPSLAAQLVRLNVM